MTRFSSQVILVTGASLGVGRACAERFHAEGARLVLVARRRGPLDEVAARLGAPERVLVHPADLGDARALPGVVDAALSRWGRLDGLVNNAGAHFRGPVEARAPDELAAMVDVNLRAPVVLTRLALPHLRATRGFVVNVASLAGKVPLGGAATYSATKFGLRAFTFALAEELRGTGVRVSAVSPGPIDTGFIMDALDEVADITLSQPVCSADHVARMVLDAAEDGRLERAWPPGAGRLATLGYLAPGLRRLLLPLLARKGRRRKARLLQEPDRHR